jgi:hypothetical protein
MKLLVTASAVALVACVTVASASTRPDSHAPISVMGEHIHNKGELMLSYRYMHMSMQGNRRGSSDISANEIVTTIPNRFANPPTMPPTLRVVPTEMTMAMHMAGVMYAPSDSVTLMAMLNYTDKEMDHVTFAGPMGTNRLGKFTTKTRGIGDTAVSALVRIPTSGSQQWHATLGISLPTGSVDETDTILTPMNSKPTVRLPYPMQLGSGTYDLITGLTYTDHSGAWGWGGQWRSVSRLGENDEHYSRGDEHRLQGWISYLANESLSLSGRLGYYDRGDIDGIDPAIRAPAQTADPSRQGVRQIDLGLGANYLLPGHRHRMSLELTVPIAQNLDGPQLETDWAITLGWQFAP